MRKGQSTKEHIIRESAALFNTKGYTGASLSDIIERSGVRKGGIYNHFENKEELALAAFDYSFSKIIHYLSEALEKTSNAKDSLLSVCNVYIAIIEENKIEGGCPILNTAIECDDGSTVLKDRAQHAMKLMMEKLTTIIKSGVESKEFKKSVKPEEVSSYIIAVIEGGIMLSKLFDESKYIHYSVTNVRQYIEEQMLIL